MALIGNRRAKKRKGECGPKVSGGRAYLDNLKGGRILYPA